MFMNNQLFAIHKKQLKIATYMPSPLIIILLWLEVMLNPKIIFFF
jgi:hypothetical protein